MFDPVALKLYVLRLLNSLQIFDDNDLKFVAEILDRPGTQVSPLMLLKPLVDAAKTYSKANFDGDLHADWEAQFNLVCVMTHLKNTAFRQPYVLIACPQRARHLPEGAPPPNIANLVIPQSIRAIADQCFGLDHCAARNYFVEKALRPGASFTHILFVDDDQLLRQDTLGFLLKQNLDAVGVNYTKRNAQLESIATQLVPDEHWFYRNETVSCEDPNDVTPREVNAIGMGAFLIRVDALRKLPAPWFFFTHEMSPAGEKGAPVVGEDANLVRSLIRAGVKSYIIPGGPVSPHCSFEESKAKGKPVFYGPKWLIDPDTRDLRPEYVNSYTKFVIPPGQLFVPHDIDTPEGHNVFNRRKQAA